MIYFSQKYDTEKHKCIFHHPCLLLENSQEKLQQATKMHQQTELSWQKLTPSVWQAMWHVIDSCYHHHHIFILVMEAALHRLAKNLYICTVNLCIMYFKVPHRWEIATIRFPGWTLFQGVKFSNFTFTRSLHSANRLLNLLHLSNHGTKHNQNTKLPSKLNLHTKWFTDLTVISAKHPSIM